MLAGAGGFGTPPGWVGRPRRESEGLAKVDLGSPAPLMGGLGALSRDPARSHLGVTAGFEIGDVP